MLLIVFLASIAFALSGLAVQSAESPVYVPLSFRKESKPIRTGACLQVSEILHSQPKWWDSPELCSTPSSRAFKAIIDAIRANDSEKVAQLSRGLANTRDERIIKEAGAFVSQLSRADLLAVPRSYAFDSIVVFFAQFRIAEKPVFLPFVFVAKTDGTFVFAPYRDDLLAYRLFKEWFDAMGKRFDDIAYCGAQDIAGATHRLQLPRVEGNTNYPLAQIFLRGGSISSTGLLANLTTNVGAVLEKMKAALADDNVENFSKNLTPEGANQFKTWFKTANATERSNYKKAIFEHDPFFIFDASPLVIVYTRSAMGRIEVMYFTYNEVNELLWTNSARVTLLDSVFKKGPLIDAARQERPFESLSIK